MMYVYFLETTLLALSIIRYTGAFLLPHGVRRAPPQLVSLHGAVGGGEGPSDTTTEPPSAVIDVVVDTLDGPATATMDHPVGDADAKRIDPLENRMVYPSIQAMVRDNTNNSTSFATSRRVFTNRVSMGVLASGLVGSGVLFSMGQQATTPTKPTARPAASSSSTSTPTLEPVNITKVAAETNINITVVCENMCMRVDSKTFQKKSTLKLPGWVPSYLIPPPKVVRDFSNTELFVAAVVAGSAVEMGRTAVLYPVQTLKTRIQTGGTRSSRRFYLRRRIKILRLQVQRHLSEGNLYAGLLPSLLISVPAMGVYYGARDVTKRMLLSLLAPVPLAVAAAFIADVVSLMLRTPADTLAVRLQAATALAVVDEDPVVDDIAEALVEARVADRVGNWWSESLERLPAVIATDLPYLLIRIAVNSVLIPGPIDVGRYELVTFASACACAFLTTPFDVVRTRILVEGAGGETTPRLVPTFRAVIQEGDGGYRNLYAGWLERTVYLGISSLWLPFALVFYTGIRDTILLEWF